MRYCLSEHQNKNEVSTIVNDNRKINPDPIAGRKPSDNQPEPESRDHPVKPPVLVNRKTGLRGRGIAPRYIRQNTIRNHTDQDLRVKDPEIPWIKAERAIHDLVCSLMERQDRMNEDILLRVIDLEYRMDDFERDYAPRTKRREVSGRVAP
ncbi:MAG: hypothetical protein Q7T80_15235 [Methanoregula sp.]|nr:hypothetical protein [Methanoregula sp.]